MNLIFIGKDLQYKKFSLVMNPCIEVWTSDEIRSSQLKETIELINFERFSSLYGLKVSLTSSSLALGELQKITKKVGQ